MSVIKIEKLDDPADENLQGKISKSRKKCQLKSELLLSSEFTFKNCEEYLTSEILKAAYKSNNSFILKICQYNIDYKSLVINELNSLMIAERKYIQYESIKSELYPIWLIIDPYLRSIIDILTKNKTMNDCNFMTEFFTYKLNITWALYPHIVMDDEPQHISMISKRSERKASHFGTADFVIKFYQ